MQNTNFPVLDKHRQALRAEFKGWLLAKGPTAVLDLGAGAGALVADLTAAGVNAVGIESSSEALAAR